LTAQTVPERQTKRFRLDLEHVALACSQTLAVREGRSSKEVDMDVAWSAEKRVFEMVRLEIRDRVRHILFTG
jgi:hypothetical protein